MGKKIIFIINYWFPPILLMGFIFYLSSRSSFAVAENYWLNFFVFKTLHLCEYALLFVLWFRAFNYDAKHNEEKKRFWGAFLLSFVWAVLDEVHQLFVPTRQGTIRDILIDSMGMLFAFYLIRRILPQSSPRMITLANKLGI